MIRSATPSYVPYPRRRLGDTSTQIAGQVGSTVGTGLSVVGAASGAGLITLSSTLAAAIPVAGAVAAVGVLLFSLLHNSRGLQQDAETTAVVNKGEALMQQNLSAWNASTKNFATQAAALNNFDTFWSNIANFCGQASEGSPGQRCISERQRGGIYDYFQGYRDPIANDPHAGDPDRAAAMLASAAASQPAIASANAPTISPAFLLIAAGALLVASEL